MSTTASQFRKKPIVIEAQQWTGENINDLWDWITAEFMYGPIPAEDAVPTDSEGKSCPAQPARPARLYVAANDAWLDLDIGEWIIRDSLGFYPCKASVFAATYDAAVPERASTIDPTRRTKRRFAHELYPHADEGQTRSLHVEVPYLYARMVGMEIQGTNWFKARPYSIGNDRTMEFVGAARTALLADALHQGMTGDPAWLWANERIGDDMECAYERADLYGVPIRSIKPYPCGGDPDHHDHLTPTSKLGWSTVTRAPGAESDCDECTEPIPAPPQTEQFDLTKTNATAPGQAEPSATGDLLNPDCRSGKCKACSGTAWDDATDSLTACACACHVGRTS